MNNEIVTLDVRDEIRNGREPLSKIMKAIRELRPGQKFRLIAPFRPVPLFGLLERKGFVHEAREVQNGDWEVVFKRCNESCEKKEDSPEAQDNRKNSFPMEAQFIDVDARGLEPPQPMVKILEALANLPEGTGIRAYTDRRPMHLYAQLEARGFTCQSGEQNDGSFITHIRAR